MKYSHQVYGLNVLSDIDFPELDQGSIPSADQITISSTTSLGDFLNARRINPYLQATKREIRLKIPKAVTISIVNGEHIYYQPEPGVDENTLRLFILGSGIGALLQQRGYLVLHGNAIEMDDGGCLICVGTSGIGKSTTAAAMMQRGFKITADDVCPITSTGNVIPGMPRIKLWQETAALLSVSTTDLKQIMPDMMKYNLPLGDAYAPNSLKVNTLIELDTHEGCDILIEPVSGAEKFILVKRNSYRYEYLLAMNNAFEHFKKTEQFVQGLPMFKVKRPIDGFAIEPLLDTLINTYTHTNDVSRTAAR